MPYLRGMVALMRSGQINLFCSVFWLHFFSVIKLYNNCLGFSIMVSLNLWFKRQVKHEIYGRSVLFLTEIDSQKAVFFWKSQAKLSISSIT